MKTSRKQKKFSKELAVLKNMIFDIPVTGPYAEGAFLVVEREMQRANLISMFIKNFRCYDFEGKKCVVQIFNNMLRRSIGVPSITVKYICKKPKILLRLMAGYENEENAHDCHSMLSECTRYQQLAKKMLHSEAFFNLFRYIEVLKCDVSFAAFSMLKQLLTGHKRLCAKFLEQNYDVMFTHYKQLLSSENYIIRRESVGLLSTLLDDWHNVTIKRKYISDPDNLQLIVNMLSEKHRCVPHNAYDVLKLFVTNPDKPRPIIDILVHNREKLNHYIFQVTTDRPEDAQLVAEKIGLIITITYLTSD